MSFFYSKGQNKGKEFNDLRFPVGSGEKAASMLEKHSNEDGFDHQGFPMDCGNNEASSSKEYDIEVLTVLLTALAHDENPACVAEEFAPYCPAAMAVRCGIEKGYSDATFLAVEWVRRKYGERASEELFDFLS
jgi:hypothetical protein